jgi:hypothetical protein
MERARRMGTRVAGLLPGPRRTPFTFWYLLVLAATTLLIRLATPEAAHRLLAMSSTDAVNLAHRPVSVLILSALWLVDGHWLAYAAIFSLVLAPVERRIGWRWTALVFASGHVLATLATELPVLWATRAHLLPHGDAHLLDVGVSYGFYATAGALLLMLATPARWWVLALLNLSIAGIYLTMGVTSADSVVTAAGHTLALYTGLLGWLPLLRTRGLIGSVRLRLPRLPWIPPTPAGPAGPETAPATP